MVQGRNLKSHILVSRAILISVHRILNGGDRQSQKSCSLYKTWIIILKLFFQKVKAYSYFNRYNGSDDVELKRRTISDTTQTVIGRREERGECNDYLIYLSFYSFTCDKNSANNTHS